MLYNPYPSINLPFGKDNKWFVYLFESIHRVDLSFIKYKLKFEDGQCPESEEYKAHLERVFAYELYRQWMNLLEKHGVRNLVLNAEICKYLKNSLNEERKGKDNYPDLVLHKSQDSDEAQLIVCEIKREEGLTDENLLGDLYKLSCYINKDKFWKKPFEYGVFIIEGIDVSLNKLKIKQGTTTQFKGEEITIEEYKNNESFKKKFSQIICVSYDGTNLEYDLLDKLIDKITKED